MVSRILFGWAAALFGLASRVHLVSIGSCSSFMFLNPPLCCLELISKGIPNILIASEVAILVEIFRAPVKIQHDPYNYMHGSDVGDSSAGPVLIAVDLLLDFPFDVLDLNRGQFIKLEWFL